MVAALVVVAVVAGFELGNPFGHKLRSQFESALTTVRKGGRGGRSIFAATFVSLGCICIVYQFASFEFKPSFVINRRLPKMFQQLAMCNVQRPATLPVAACNNCQQIVTGHVRLNNQIYCQHTQLKCVSVCVC